MDKQDQGGTTVEGEASGYQGGRSDEEVALGLEVGVTMTWPGYLAGPGGVQFIMGFPKPTLQGLC